MSDFDRETQEYLDHGLNLLLSYWFDDNEQEHCKLHWSYIGNPDKGIYVDMGSGTGTFGYNINKLMPDLKIYNVTNSLFQHQYQQTLFQDVSNLESKLESFTKTSFDDNSVDIITFNESFGYENLNKTFPEVSRILKPGGKLFIKECFVLKNKPPIIFQWEKIWNYVWYSADEIISSGQKHNLNFDKCIRVPASAEKFIEFWKASTKMQQWFGPPAELPLRQAVGIFCFTKP